MSTSVRLFEIAVATVGLAACSPAPPAANDGNVADDGDVAGDRDVAGDGDVASDGSGDVGGSVDGQGGGGDAAPSVAFLSCDGLPATCGADGTDTCCNSPDVVGGTYFRSFDVANDPSSGTKSFPAAVSNFRLDKYEVTVGRFRAFVNAGMGTRANPPAAGSGAHPNLAGSGWTTSFNASLLLDTAALVEALNCEPTFQTWTDAAGDNENRPMNCVSWFEAMAFCIWDGGYLPTEAEWNYAAAGGDQQRAFPWSTPPGSLELDPGGTNASFSPDGGITCVGDGRKDCELTDLVFGGTKPAGDGRWGQSELAGNLAEWTLDTAGPYPGKCTDCANIAPTNRKIHRGGNFSQGKAVLRTGARASRFPLDHTDFIGIRCARAPSPASSSPQRF